MLRWQNVIAVLGLIIGVIQLLFLPLHMLFRILILVTIVLSCLFLIWKKVKKALSTKREKNLEQMVNKFNIDKLKDIYANLLTKSLYSKSKRK